MTNTLSLTCPSCYMKFVWGNEEKMSQVRTHLSSCDSYVISNTNRNEFIRGYIYQKEVSYDRRG